MNHEDMLGIEVYVLIAGMGCLPPEVLGIFTSKSKALETGLSLMTFTEEGWREDTLLDTWRDGTSDTWFKIRKKEIQ